MNGKVSTEVELLMDKRRQPKPKTGNQKLKGVIP